MCFCCFVTVCAMLLYVLKTFKSSRRLNVIFTLFIAQWLHGDVIDVWLLCWLVKGAHQYSSPTSDTHTISPNPKPHQIIKRPASETTHSFKSSTESSSWSTEHENTRLTTVLMNYMHLLISKWHQSAMQHLTNICVNVSKHHEKSQWDLFSISFVSQGQRWKTPSFRTEISIWTQTFF